MANIVLAPPMPEDAASGQGGATRWVPYASGGLGAIRTRIESDLGLVDVKETNFGWNAGAGVMASWNRFGVRGDARYFRAMQEEFAEDVLSDEDDQKCSFWRVTGGMVLRWGGM